MGYAVVWMTVHAPCGTIRTLEDAVPEERTAATLKGVGGFKTLTNTSLLSF